MNIKKYVAFAVSFLLLMITTAYADTVAEYIIKDDSYNPDTKTYTAQVYLSTMEYLSAGTFGMSYDMSLSPVFTLDENNFEEVQRFDSGDSPYIALQWYTNDIPTLTGEIHLGTIIISNVEWDEENNIPAAWNKQTIRQLDWLTTDISQQTEFTDTYAGICLNEEIWREFTDDEKAEISDKTINGYYQGCDWIDDDNYKWSDIGFLYLSQYELPDKEGQNVSGIVQGYNPDSEKRVTVTLYRKGEAEAYQSITPETYLHEYPDGRVICSYEFTEVEEGEYMLEIKKDVHLTYRTDINVEKNKDVCKDKIILYCGDIHEDEKIKLDDRSILRRYLNKQIKNDSNLMMKRSDLNGDGKITFHDFDILKTYYNRSYKGAVQSGT